MSRQHLDQDKDSELIWILGGGQFGRHAASMLRQASPSADIIMVEKENPDALPENITFIHDDGVTWLIRNLTPKTPVSKIVPALPLHLAFEWLKELLILAGVSLHPIDIPAELLRRLPHPVRQSSSQAVISHADFLCPAHCSEPGKKCTYTGKPRPPALHHLVENLEYAPFTPLVIRSRQFAPGVGGFFPDDLWQLYSQARSNPKTPLLVATACKCHGIVDGLIIDH